MELQWNMINLYLKRQTGNRKWVIPHEIVNIMTRDCCREIIQHNEMKEGKTGWISWKYYKCQPFSHSEKTLLNQLGIVSTIIVTSTNVVKWSEKKKY